MTKKKPAKKPQQVNEYILLDRSGSIASHWEETLGAINAYVKKTADDGTDSIVTVLTFDSNSIDEVRKSVPVKKWDDLTNKDAQPRGMTPLFDAIGRALNDAEKRDAEKTVVIVMTDGHENRSREYTKAQIGARIEAAKTKGWQVIFMGADFNAFGEASAVGVNMNQTINLSSGHYGDAMRGLSTMKTMYASGTVGTMSFSDEDRAVASGDKTTK